MLIFNTKAFDAPITERVCKPSGMGQQHAKRNVTTAFNNISMLIKAFDVSNCWVESTDLSLQLTK